jgi:acetyl-CoA acetyltransferase
MEAFRGKIIIAGVGESDIGHVPTMSGLGLVAQASLRALDDAGLTLKDVDGLLTAYSVTEPYPMLGSVTAEYLGIEPSYCASMVVGGATPAIMLRHAAQAVASGACKTVLCCAGENRATGQTRDSAVQAVAAMVGHPYFESVYGPTIPALYAMVARRHMHKYGTTSEHLAAVAVQARDYASRHPNAHMRKPITIADVLASKPIAEPLHLLDCCLISDAAGAFIVTAADGAHDLARRPAYLLGIGEHHTHEHITSAPSLTEFGSVQSGQRAFAMAGLKPSDIDFAELYDCFTIVPIVELEDLGFVERGEGGPFFLAGETGPSGRLPVNTHGGMHSYAHGGAVGGLFGIVEAVRQLRGDQGPRQLKRHQIALVHNEGGILSSHCTAILGASPS